MRFIDREKILKNTKTYTERDSEVRFPLGGIGTGSISLGSRGELRDWEIFNAPNKNTPYPYSFFSLFSQVEGEAGQVRILEARLQPPFYRPTGYPSFEAAGIPRFAHIRTYGRGPFFHAELEEETLPLAVSLTAYSPLIPTDEENSGIPAISFRYTVTNTGDKPCMVSVCGTLSNFTSHSGSDLFGNLIIEDDLKNEAFDDGHMKGIFYSSSAPKESRRYGTMCLATTSDGVSMKPEWLAGGWCDGIHDFIDEFTRTGKLTPCAELKAERGKLEADCRLKTGSVACSATLLAGESKSFDFILAWCFPNRPRSWEGHICPARDCKDETVKNHYAYAYPDAYAAAKKLASEDEMLRAKSAAFADALFSSDLDREVIDAINGTLPVLRSTTCFRIGKEGTFLCWEGCFDHRGSCEGNCTHVWNYAQALAFLFPRLEQSMRRTEFMLETGEDGNMAFRTMQVFGDKKWEMLPAADGQLGCVVRLYRDWKFSGDEALLRDCYSGMKRALDFAFTYWDTDGDFVLDGCQHNTYDIEFYGENSLTNSIFFAALKAGAEMAEHIGDTETAERWRTAFTLGSARMDEKLYRGGYYIQSLPDLDRYRFQYGDGCLSDQLLGQTLAHLNGLGYILPPEHVHTAIKCIYDNNFRASFADFVNVQRAYALNEESGLLVCSWPQGTTRPRIPFIYADEVWSGIEYQVATCLVYEGYEEEALEIVRAVRGRYNGKNRNPFNENECGNHYARSLASYGLLLAFTGYRFDAAKREISFKAQERPYLAFFTTADAFGLCKIQGDHCDVEVLHGNLDGVKITIQGGKL